MLKPETVKTYELIYEQFIAEHVKMSVGGFYYKITELIRQQTDPDDGLLVNENSGDVSTKGIEFEIESKWKNGLQGRFSYTYLDAKDSFTRTIPVNSPRSLAKLNLIIPVYPEKIFAGLEMQYVGPRKTPLNRTAGGAFVGNATLFAQQIVKDLEFSFSVYNVLDKKYVDPGGDEHPEDAITQDGRSVRAKLTYRFP